MRQLQKLTKRTFLSDGVSVPDEFRPVYDRLLAEVAESSQIHTEFERRIWRDSEEPLRVSTSAPEWAVVRKQDEALAPTLKEISSLESQLAKDQKRYDSKRTAAAQSRVQDTQRLLARAQGHWDTHADSVFQAYERADLFRLSLLRDTVRRFCRAQGSMGRRTLDMARASMQIAEDFRPEADVLLFATGARVPDRGVGDAESLGAPASPQPTVIENTGSSGPAAGLKSALNRLSLHPGRDSEGGSIFGRRAAGTPSSSDARTSDDRASTTAQHDARDSPRFSVPLPSALMNRSHSHPQMPSDAPRAAPDASAGAAAATGVTEPSEAPFSKQEAMVEPTTNTKVNPPGAPGGPGGAADPVEPATAPVAAAERAQLAPGAPPAAGTRSSGMHIADAPLPSNTSNEDTEALERVRTQLRSGSQPYAGPWRARRDTRTSAAPEAAPEAPAAAAAPPTAAAPAPPAAARPAAAARAPSAAAAAVPRRVTPLPVSARITERVSVALSSKGASRVVVVGEVALTLHAEPTPLHAAYFRLRLEGTEAVDKRMVNPAVAQEVADVPGEYDVRLQDLAMYGGDGVIVVRYQLRVSDGEYLRYVPLQIEPMWRCEPQQSSLLVTYRPNAASDLVPHTGGAARLTGLDFSVSIPLDTRVAEGVLSRPTGDWDPVPQQIHWRLPESVPLLGGEAGKLLARFPMLAQGTPQPISVTWRVPGVTFGNVGLRVAAVTAVPDVEITRLERETAAGAYTAQP